jgi:hypothetical protein
MFLPTMLFSPDWRTLPLLFFLVVRETLRTPGCDNTEHRGLKARASP